MGKIIAVIVLIGMLIGLGWAIHSSGYDSGVADEKVIQAEVTRLAVKAAREKEQKAQGEINEGLQKQYDELAGINDNLASSLIRLRTRAKRQHMSDSSKTDCAGSTGAELSAEDGYFLIREATRADKIRAALKACYTYADSVATE